MWYYLLVFLATFLVDLVPFVGPPAWTVMVLIQMKFDLNIGLVLIIGVVGSTFGRYLLSCYVPWLSGKFLKVQKKEDLVYLGTRLSGKGWKIQLFVFLYTLMPLPSTPLFTAVGVARIKPMNIIPAFFIGKFISDMVMVLTGDYLAHNAGNIGKGFLSWQSIAGTMISLLLILLIFFIDWRLLLQQKKITLNFKIWK